MNTNWWKWGNPAESRHLNDYPKLKNMVEERWKTQLQQDFAPPSDFQLTELSDEKKDEILKIFSNINPQKISFKNEDRVAVALGKSYYDIIRIFGSKEFVSPDLVITPTSHAEIQEIIEKASENNIKIIPFGGGSNVVGALSLDNIKDQIKCTLDLRQYKNLISIDEIHHTATFEAGIFGPELEKILQDKGYTLGHFPQSFEYSSLGGWVVTRGAGQESSYYGKMEDLAEHFKIATPIGTIETNTYTHDAAGINVLPMFIGSEGTLGVVTEVTVKIKKLPKKHHWIVALFPNFEKGSAYLHHLAQSGAKPAVVRFSDFNETFLFSKMSNEENTGFFTSFKKKIQKYILEKQGLTQPCLMILRFPEKSYSIASEVDFAKNLVKNFDGMIAPNKIGDNWEANRFKLPYLRDTLVEHRIYIDTMETMIHWGNETKLHQKLSENLKKSDAFNQEKGMFLAHISHIYPNACCMYFTLITPMKKGDEAQQWQDLKNLVSDTIVENGGSISHHHSVGLDHQKWYKKQTDSKALEILKSLKQKIDPNQILNPGKLFS